MYAVKIFSGKYASGIAVVYGKRFRERLAKYMIRLMVEEFCEPDGLAELREALLGFVPRLVGEAVEREIDVFFAESGEMEIEGFVNFRLDRVRRGLWIMWKTMLIRYAGIL